MKKLITILSLLTVLASLVFADIHPRYRNIELGFDTSFSAQQNLFTIDDIMKETVVIDFTKISNDLGKNDFTISTNGNANAYFDLKIAFLSFGVYVNLFDVTGGFSISKDIFELIGKGNALDEEKDYYLGSRFEAFSDFYIPVGVDLGKIKFTVAPSIFIPLFYMPDTKAGVTYKADSKTGQITLKANADAKIYTVFGMEDTPDNSLPMLDMNNILGNYGSYFSFAGFDLMGSAEYELFDNLDVGAYINLPVVPGTLNYGLNAKVEYDLPVSSISDLLALGDDSSSDAETPDGETPDGDDPDNNEPKYTVSTFSNAKYKVNRPFRLGAEASFRPFGKWFAVRPSLGIAARNPFGKDKSCVYPEYALNVDMRLAYVICLSFTSAYQNQIFVQEAGFGFNFKVLEVTANIASSGTSFGKSFGLGGVMAKINIKTGW